MAFSMLFVSDVVLVKPGGRVMIVWVAELRGDVERQFV